VDAEGKLGDLTKGMGSGYSRSFNRVKYLYSLARPAKKVKFAITWYSKQEKVAVPVDLAVGIGL
jgi:hypothetical protein